MLCPGCTRHRPLAHFVAAEWAASKPLYHDFCAICQEELRAEAAAALAAYFATVYGRRAAA